MMNKFNFGKHFEGMKADEILEGLRKAKTTAIRSRSLENTGSFSAAGSGHDRGGIPKGGCPDRSRKAPLTSGRAKMGESSLSNQQEFQTILS
jgi:hypothetical protein